MWGHRPHIESSTNSIPTRYRLSISRIFLLVFWNRMHDHDKSQARNFRQAIDRKKMERQECHFIPFFSSLLPSCLDFFSFECSEIFPTCHTTFSGEKRETVFLCHCVIIIYNVNTLYHTRCTFTANGIRGICWLFLRWMFYGFSIATRAFTISAKAGVLLKLPDIKNMSSSLCLKPEKRKNGRQM